MSLVGHVPWDVLCFHLPCVVKFACFSLMYQSHSPSEEASSLLTSLREPLVEPSRFDFVTSHQPRRDTRSLMPCFFFSCIHKVGLVMQLMNLLYESVRG